jgi:hypothetical protein
MTKARRVPVSERALIARVNRKLAKESWPKVLKVAHPGSRLENNLGRFYILDTYTNNVVDYGFDLADYPRLVECIANYEEIAE